MTSPVSVFQGLAQNRPTSLGVAANPTATTRTEAGVGAMVSWAGALWFTTYPDENGNGGGLGLHRVGPDWKVQLVAETNGTHAGRAVFGDYAFIGEHKVHMDGTVVHLTGFSPEDRITGWCKLPADPTYLYALTMGGLVYKCAATGTNVQQVTSATTGLAIAGQPHFKACWGVKNRLYVVSNRDAPDGRFGYWDNATNTWTRLETLGYSHIEVAGSYDGDGHAFAFGQDGYTGWMYLLDGLNTNPAAPRRFLIPLASKQQVWSWQQEWMRLRMADTERFLLDFHGGWFQLSPFLEGSTDPTIGMPRLEPIGRHVRTNTDFTVHNGKLVLSGNQSSGQAGNRYPNTGQPQSSLVLLDSTDELLRNGKPTGSGYIYRNTNVATANVISDPMLARGYDRKCLHLSNGSASSVDVDVILWLEAGKFKHSTITVPAGSYVASVLPAGLACDWISLRTTTAVNPFTARLDFT